MFYQGSVVEWIQWFYDHMTSNTKLTALYTNNNHKRNKHKTQSVFNYETDNSDNNVYKPYKVNHYNNAVAYCGDIVH